MISLPPGWSSVADETRQPYFNALQNFVAAERREHTVYPPADQVYHALAQSDYATTRVVILGQDPYHDEGQAHGLSFSVRPGVKPPPSLRNIFRELQDDLGIPPPDHGCLEAWSQQGVLLLNTVLTVRAHQPGSHRGQGWERFTDAIIRTLGQRQRPVVFILWGNDARQKRQLLAEHHTVIESAHPSPLAARRGFFGSRPFSRVNAALEACHEAPIDWRLPPIGVVSSAAVDDDDG